MIKIAIGATNLSIKYQISKIISFFIKGIKNPFTFSFGMTKPTKIALKIAPTGSPTFELAKSKISKSFFHQNLTLG